MQSSPFPTIMETFRGIRLFRLLALGAFLLAAAFPALAQAQGPSQAPAESGKISLATGSVEYAAPGAGFVAARRGDVLPVGTTVRTGPGSRAVIVAGPGAAIRVGESTTVVLTQLALAEALQGAVGANDILIDVKEGTMSALIDRAKQPDANFQVRTPQGVAAARGTFYAVSVKGESSYVKVRRGVVRVTNYAAANPR